MTLYIERVFRDQTMIDKLEKQVANFLQEVEEEVEFLKKPQGEKI